jgi:hypothetical protein
MRKAHITWFAAAGLVALAGGVLTIPEALPASAAAPSGQADRHNVIRLTSETRQFAVIDVGEKGPALGLGDQLVSSDQVFRNGKSVGRSGTVATVVGTTKDALTTQWVTTIDLPEGQLVLQGIGDGPTGPPTVPLSFTIGVTGGTGAFSRARGIAEVVDNPGGKEEVTIRLSD